MRNREYFQVLAAAAASILLPTFAADIVMKPPATGGVTITNAAGNTTRFRVGEDGAVSLPGLAAASTPSSGLCIETATSKVGICKTGTAGTTFSKTLLKISGVTTPGGEEILAFSWGVSNSTTMHLGGGGGAGKASVQDVSISQTRKFSAIGLLTRVLTGSPFPSVIIEHYEPADTLVYVYTLSNTIVSSASTGGSAGAEIGYNFTFNFSKFTVNDVINSTSTCFDIVANATC